MIIIIQMKLAIASLFTFAALAFALHAGSAAPAKSVTAPIDTMEAEATDSFWNTGTKAYMGGEERVSLPKPTYNQLAKAWAQ